MSTTAATTVTSLDSFHATPTAQRADELVRAFFDAVNADDPARTDAVLARSFLSHDVHGTRSRTGLRRYLADLCPLARRPITREESRAAVRRLYDGVVSTGRAEDVDMVAEGYIQNSAWTPDGRAAFASALVISCGAMPDGRALQAHMVAENNRLASRSVWDGTITQSGQPVDFTTLAFFRIEDGLIAEHWGSVDWVPGLPVFRAALRGGRRCLSRRRPRTAGQPGGWQARRRLTDRESRCS